MRGFIAETIRNETFFDNYRGSRIVYNWVGWAPGWQKAPKHIIWGIRELKLQNGRWAGHFNDSPILLVKIPSIHWNSLLKNSEVNKHFLVKAIREIRINEEITLVYPPLEESVYKANKVPLLSISNNWIIEGLIEEIIKF